MIENKVYIINPDDTELNFNECIDTEDHEPIKAEAERLGTVYSLKGFQNAINSEELYLGNSFIYIE